MNLFTRLVITLSAYLLMHPLIAADLCQSRFSGTRRGVSKKKQEFGLHGFSHDKASHFRLLRSIDPELANTAKEVSYTVEYFGLDSPMNRSHLRNFIRDPLGVYPERSLELKLYMNLINRLESQGAVELGSETPKLLLEINRELLTHPRRVHRGIEDTPAYQIGQWRQYRATTSLDGLTELQQEYLPSMNPFLSIDRRGELQYLSLDGLPESLTRIEETFGLKFPPKDKRELLGRYRALKADPLRSLETSRNRFVTQFRSDLIQALVRLSIAHAITCVSKGESRVHCYANLYYHLTSIHPFSNGNGRTMRAFLRLLLGPDEHFWLYDVDVDIFLKARHFETKLVEALERAEVHIRDWTVESLFHRSEEGWFSQPAQQKSSSEKKRMKLHKNRVDALFSNYVMEKLVLNSESDLDHRAYKWGKEPRFVLGASSGFIGSLTRRSLSQEDYDQKMWLYYVPEIENGSLDPKLSAQHHNPYLYRGFRFASNKVLSEPELVEVFQRVGWMHTGNGLEPDPSTRSMRQYFKRMDDLLETKTDEFDYLIASHAHERGSYDTSGLISFATEPSIANYFSTASVKSVQLQHRALLWVRNRYQASLSTTDWLGPSHGHPEEQEVLQFGWTDPESVMGLAYASFDPKTGAQQLQVFRRIDFRTIEAETFDADGTLIERRRVDLLP